MDRLLIEQIKEMYPALSVSVVVRGMPTMNDATMEDAVQVGLDKMDIIEEIAGNGNNIMGTWIPEISGEAAALMKQADVSLRRKTGETDQKRR